jgi:hypothetical protein
MSDSMPPSPRAYSAPNPSPWGARLSWLSWFEHNTLQAYVQAATVGSNDRGNREICVVLSAEALIVNFDEALRDRPDDLRKAIQRLDYCSRQAFSDVELRKRFFQARDTLNKKARAANFAVERKQVSRKEISDNLCVAIPIPVQAISLDGLEVSHLPDDIARDLLTSVRHFTHPKKRQVASSEVDALCVRNIVRYLLLFNGTQGADLLGIVYAKSIGIFAQASLHDEVTLIRARAEELSPGIISRNHERYSGAPSLLDRKTRLLPPIRFHQRPTPRSVDLYAPLQERMDALYGLIGKAVPPEQRARSKTAFLSIQSPDPNDIRTEEQHQNRKALIAALRNCVLDLDLDELVLPTLALIQDYNGEDRINHEVEGAEWEEIHTLLNNIAAQRLTGDTSQQMLALSIVREISKEMQALIRQSDIKMGEEARLAKYVPPTLVQNVLLMLGLWDKPNS